MLLTAPRRMPLPAPPFLFGHLTPAFLRPHPQLTTRTLPFTLAWMLNRPRPGVMMMGSQQRPLRSTLPHHEQGTHASGGKGPLMRCGSDGALRLTATTNGHRGRRRTTSEDVEGGRMLG